MARLHPALTAKRLLETIGFPDSSLLDIKALIEYHDGVVVEKPLKNSDGRIVIKGVNSIITVNSDIEYAPKKRFVLAHELGHLLLHKEDCISFSDDYRTLDAMKNGKQEAEANDFATELLMPTFCFLELIFQKKFTPDLLRDLSEKFNTSLTSVVYRYLEIGHHPICIFYSKDGKVIYWKKSLKFPHYIGERNGLSVPSDSVANEFYQYGRVYSKADSIQEITKSTWFELSKYDSKDPTFYEYCIVTKKYNTVLSIVWEK
jgi:Zn-dependent peptidase ImmA (M78 family)